ncbi:MAG TPA: hypothetical protein VJ888_08820 [Mobilitalea sp.]|nr:hypothetical protein [Mobilitalea sp.]
MNVKLLYNCNEGGAKSASMNKNEVIKDLNLDILFKFMARNDKYIYNTVRSVMLAPLTDKATVLYRQAILSDCIQNYNSFSQIYEMTCRTIEETERFTKSIKKSSSAMISNSVNILHSLELLGILVDNLEKLKEFTDTVERSFTSPGMQLFYENLISDYNYEFVLKIKDSIREMNFLTQGGEITFSATVGQGLKAKNIIINHLSKEDFKKRKTKGIVTQLFYRLLKRNIILLDDTSIASDVREMEAAGLVQVMRMYQNFIKELTSFFESLHHQMAFYIGAANLKNRLDQIHIPTCIPFITSDNLDIIKFKGLYDMSMAIYSRTMPVTNDLDTQDLLLFVITGANQGGKSTFLRSVGIAQLLMQCGMFVPAQYYCNSLFDGIYTHFTRREDTAMNSGKLDEELNRISHILDGITPRSLLLLNESFATTTEREGSQIAADVVNALYENETKIMMVTHLFEFTKLMYAKKPERALFLSAERRIDGTRTFKILENEPERTSYGMDLYENIIGS